jgi:uncharacterized protein YwqG
MGCTECARTWNSTIGCVYTRRSDTVHRWSSRASATNQRVSTFSRELSGDTSSRAWRRCVISLCTRAALDSAARGRSTAALAVMSNIIRTIFGRKKTASGSARDVGDTAAPLERVALHVVRVNTPTRSHLGGGPGLPPGIAWPQREGRNLRFLARLSLSELQAVELTDWLPQSGALLFFYDDDQQPWGFDPMDRGGWAVLHVPDVPATSALTAPETAGLLPYSSVELRRIQVLPSYERPDVQALSLSDSEVEKYIEIADQRFGRLPKHQLLGLPSPVQGDSMELECQLASNGVNCGTPEGYANARAKELGAGAQNWRLLFQMDSDDDLEVMWGDVGMLYFWIEEAAGRRGDFSNVWLVLQCA